MTDPQKIGMTNMLVNLDLARELGSGRSAHTVAPARWSYRLSRCCWDLHAYRHDIESFFYALIWQCARHGWEFLDMPRDQSTSKLRAWYAGKYEDIANAKLSRMSKAEDDA
ncbi:hypothetical protein PMIN03_012941 [Paraphaeosphaeria minitans]